MKGLMVFVFAMLAMSAYAVPFASMCPGGGVGGYFAHPTDCTKFIQCGYGGPFVMPCAPGTHWNDRLKTCDHPWNAGCSTGGSSGCCGCESECGRPCGGCDVPNPLPPKCNDDDCKDPPLPPVLPPKCNDDDCRDPPVLPPKCNDDDCVLPPKCNDDVC